MAAHRQAPAEPRGRAALVHTLAVALCSDLGIQLCTHRLKFRLRLSQRRGPKPRGETLAHVTPSRAAHGTELR